MSWQIKDSRVKMHKQIQQLYNKNLNIQILVDNEWK